MCTEWNSLARLVCGEPQREVSEINDILIRLGDTITKFSNKLIQLNYEDENDRMNIPFYARSIMEASCTSLVARIDPFRILVIYKVQSSSEYDITKKSNAALQWTGDVIAAGRPKANLWNPDNKLDDYDRALLSNYNGELFWKPGFIKAIDYIESQRTSSNWLNRFKGMDENQFFERTKTEASKLYSSFSKGIHYEFLVNVDSIFDATTVQSLVSRMLELFAELSMVSHFIESMSGKLEYQLCVGNFIEVEEMIRNGGR